MLYLSSSNLILHATLCLSLTVFLSFLKIPAFFLYGLHTYVHPDDVAPPNSNSSRGGGGIRAAIRRPGTFDSEHKPRKKSKDKFEFDENKAQIFRLKLNDDHLQTRVYYTQFSSAFNSSLVAISCLLLHRFLRASKDSGILENGSVIPILLGIVGVCRLLILIAKLSFERSASKSFMPTHYGAETDLRFVFCAGNWSGLDREKAKDYIIECQSYDGGFGLIPGSESHEC